MEKAIRLVFQALINKAEYEALLAGVRLVVALGVTKLQIFSDSQLVVNQIIGEYITKDERMTAYHDMAKKELGQISKYSI